MRMWNVNPKFLCRAHLLGEHKEIHMLAGSLIKQKNLKGFYDLKRVDPSSMLERHSELVAEMKFREYRHESPMPELNGIELPSIDLDVAANLVDLKARCSECLRRIDYWHRKGWR